MFLVRIHYALVSWRTPRKCWRAAPLPPLLARGKTRSAISVELRVRLGTALWGQPRYSVPIGFS
jgi:hypothetical protein